MEKNDTELTIFFPFAEVPSDMNSIRGKRFFSSWSGGKDSCLALYHALRNSAEPHGLFTMFAEDGMRSRSHGLDYKILEAQAKALSMPLITCNASWGDYEKKFVKQLNRFKNEGMGAGVFGDIDLEPHRAWVEGVCKQAGIKPYLPLWKRGRQELLDEFLAFGFSAIIIAVKDDILDNSFLGRNLDKQTIMDLENAGVDASGEKGEYHTMVTAGPIFSAHLAIRRGDIIMRDGYWFLDISLV